MSDTIEVFISYSKQDKELRDGLLAHLRPLERQGIISWHDRQILPGTKWDEEIKARLNAADIILLLISADFLATDYCAQVEIPEALRRHEAGEATVMPVILRSCGWKYTPLAAIQAYPEKAKPIKSWVDIDDAYTDVVEGVYLAAIEIKKRRAQKTQQAEQARQLEQQRQAEEKERLRQAERSRQQPQQLKQELEKKWQQDLTNEWEWKPSLFDVPKENSTLSETLMNMLAPFESKELSFNDPNFTQLEALLKAGRWKEADQETARQIYKAMGKQEQDHLGLLGIKSFRPCTHLHTIDQLWVKHSKGKFGFSIQKQIWEECGSPSRYDELIEFYNRVGWRKGFIRKSWIKYSDLTFDTSAPKGHLPVLQSSGERVYFTPAVVPLLSRTDL
jgi:GUN4-like/TIR domain